MVQAVPSGIWASGRQAVLTNCVSLAQNPSVPLSLSRALKSNKVKTNGVKPVDILEDHAVDDYLCRYKQREVFPCSSRAE